MEPRHIDDMCIVHIDWVHQDERAFSKGRKSEKSSSSEGNMLLFIKAANKGDAIRCM